MRFQFLFWYEGCLWSHQSTCEVRIQQRGVRRRGSHADVFSLFGLSFIHQLSSICSHLRSNLVQHKGNEFTYEVKYEISGSELLMHFGIASTTNFPRRSVRTNFPLMFGVTIVQRCRLCIFGFGLKQISCYMLNDCWMLMCTRESVVEAETRNCNQSFINVVNISSFFFF